MLFLSMYTKRLLPATYAGSGRYALVKLNPLIRVLFQKITLPTFNLLFKQIGIKYLKYSESAPHCTLCMVC